MKYLKLFEDYKEEIVELFNSIVIDAKISTFTHDKHNLVNIYVLYGTRIEFNDHDLLKELYDYRTIFREMYNKEYFHIIMTDSKVVIVLHDYKESKELKNDYRKIGSFRAIDDIRTDLFANKLQPDIYQLIKSDEATWKGYGCLQPGIRYTNGDRSNLSLYDWQYGIDINAKDSVKEDFNHLSSRGVDPSKTHFVHDVESNNTYFFLYNLSGDCVGYQKYNTDNQKENGLGWMGRYFTKVNKEATGHSKIAVYGLETYDINKDYFFVAEGIFDIIKVHNSGEPGIANLGCSLSRQAKNWYNTLSQKKIVIQDRDDAGTELGAVGDYVYVVPEPYKDLGDMPQSEVDIFIKNIKKDLNL